MAEDKLLDHEADGIQEYDNPLPGWWVNLFAITVVIAYYCLIGFLMNLYQPSGKHAEKAVAALKAPSTVDGNVGELEMAFTDDPQVIAMGELVYQARCATCHGKQGQGLIGPNMTDDYWIHGNTFEDMYNVVLNGVTEKGMQSWKGILSTQEMKAAVSYLHTLRGTNPPDPKAPQGELME